MDLIAKYNLTIDQIKGLSYAEQHEYMDKRDKYIEQLLIDNQKLEDDYHKQMEILGIPLGSGLRKKRSNRKSKK